MYLITVKALHVVTFPIRNLILLQNFLIRFNFLLPQDVRVILSDGVPENNTSQLMHAFWMRNYRLWFISAQEDASVTSRYCHKLTLFAVFQEYPEGNNFQLANTTHANIKIRTKEDLLA